MKKIPPENDLGDVEYKWNLSTVTEYKLNKLTSQMRWRVYEASDNMSVLYVLGTHDDGRLTGISKIDLEKTIVNLMDCANKIKMFVCLRRYERINDNYWAILQVFAHKKSTNYDLPKIPEHKIPDYLKI